MNEVISFLEKEIKANSKVVLACSGGPDSMCLLFLLNKVKSSKNLTLIVAHVNHKVREESEKEEEFLKEYVQNLGLIWEVTHFNEYLTQKFQENEAREKRYNFLENIVQKYEADYLLTAHHGDDLIETILMRLTRGSNLKGYVGIKEKTIKNNYIILRPLLRINKEDILAYNKKENIPYVIDKSNEDIKYTRNRYRQTILPILKKEDSNIHLKYYKFSKELEEYDLFVSNYIKSNNFIVDNYLLINKIKDESNFIKRKVIEVLIRNIQDIDILDISNRQVEEVLKILDKKGNKQVNLHNGYIALKEYDKLSIQKRKEKENFCYILDKNIYTDKWNIIVDLKQIDDTSNNTIYLDSKEIKLPLMVRNKKDGDKIEVKNLKGKKKVKDILIDEKIDLSKRDDVLVVTDSNNTILWLPSLKKSQFAKDKMEKYDIILKYEVKKNECEKTK